MKRILLIFLLVLILAGNCLVPAWAAELPLVIDNAALLSQTQRQTLEETAQTLSGQYQMDIVILTESTLSGTPIQEYAESYYDGNGYGDDGILLLLDMGQRQWYFSTTGNGIYAFTDYALEQLGDGILPYLSNGDYYGGFSFYMTLLPTYLEAFSEGNPADGYVPVDDSVIYEETVYYESDSGPNLMISLLIGAVAALVALLIMRSSMNTRRSQNSAADYLCDGSFRLYGRTDLFLYSNLSKTRRQQNNTNSGGSSVHRSSGGRSHGGRGGKF